MGRVNLELVGQVIDRRYRVDRCIGSGGMGTVWRAQHVQSLQYFAIKTLHVSTDLPDSSIRRCLKEARAAAALRSRNVVRITDVQPDYVHFGTALPYLVMELLEGGDLENVLLRCGALQAGEVAWVILQAARGIQLAHDHGIVHRDLKPANLFVTRDDDGEPIIKVCDFGVAKVAPELSELSEDSSASFCVVGTPRYMAPEQLRAPFRVTPALDQWAIALIAYRLLTEREYFESAENTLDLLLRITQDELVAPSELSKGLPAGFDAWFAKSCARNAAARFDSIGAQARALAAILGAPKAVVLQGRFVDHARGTENCSKPSVQPPIKHPSSSAGFGERVARTALLVAAGVSILCTALAASWLGSPTKRDAAPAQTAAPTHVALTQPSSSPFDPAPMQQTESDTESGTEPPTESHTTPSKPPSPIHAYPSARRRVRPATLMSREESLHRPSLALNEARDSSSAVVPRLETGALCSRSIQCASRLCVAERCR